MAKTKVVRGTCTVPGCTRPHKARGYCPAHLQRWMRGVEVAVPLRARDTTPKEHCSEPDCLEPVKAKGRCKMHYARLLRHGHTKYPDRKRPPKPCSIAGCENHAYAGALCSQHYARRRRLHEKYGLTQADVDAMLASQGGGCAICGLAEKKADSRSGKTVEICVDHNHETGKVRGLLCDQCNRGIGLLGDSVETLRAALAYLERHAPS